MPTFKDSDAPLVPAVFTSQAGAEAAVRALQDAGIVGTDIGLAVPVRETNRIREDSERESAEAVGRGVAFGAPLGVIGGIGIVAATLGTLGVGGLFLAGAGGLLWGGTIGG